VTAVAAQSKWHLIERAAASFMKGKEAHASMWGKRARVGCSTTLGFIDSHLPSAFHSLPALGQQLAHRHRCRQFRLIESKLCGMNAASIAGGGVVLVPGRHDQTGSEVALLLLPVRASPGSFAFSQERLARMPVGFRAPAMTSLHR
jgi:hypothetical protein